MLELVGMIDLCGYGEYGGLVGCLGEGFVEDGWVEGVGVGCDYEVGDVCVDEVEEFVVCEGVVVGEVGFVGEVDGVVGGVGEVVVDDEVCGVGGD